MREADGERDLNEVLVDYCIDILNAKEEEEFNLIKQEIVTSLKELGLNESAIQSFFAKADEMVENEDITIGEDGTVMLYDNLYAVLNTELRTPTSIPQSEQNTYGRVGNFLVGIGLTTLLSAIALKQTIFNKNKQNEDSRSR